MPYFLTFTTYGTHLPGDERGSKDRHLGRLTPQPALKQFAAQQMPEQPFRLDDPKDRQLVLQAIIEICATRQWRLIAAHIRTTHIHGLVQVEDATPNRTMGEWKIRASQALKLHWPNRQNFFTRGGSTKSVTGSIDPILHYILNRQGPPLETYCAPRLNNITFTV